MFFFKQKTAYEMRISDWSSDVCSSDLLMVVHLLSPSKRYDPLFISNYALLQVRDEIARIHGIADVVVWGAGEYSMRVWLDPARIASRGLTASDIVAAIRAQNVEVAAGSVGRQPNPAAAQQVARDVKGRLATEEELAAIVVKTGADGQLTRLGEVARIEMGATDYALRSLLDGEPAIALDRKSTRLNSS